MVEKTLDAEKLTRAEAASRLRALADAIEGDGAAAVQVGNKRITLRPRSSVGYEIGVRERSSLLRGSRESVSVTMEWKAASFSGLSSSSSTSSSSDADADAEE